MDESLEMEQAIVSGVPAQPVSTPVAQPPTPLEPVSVAPVLEAPVIESPEAVAPEPHPLDPGGVRFKQVVARAHKERDRADALETELAAIRAEIDALRQPTGSGPTTPTWVDLEQGIAEGRFTRAQANDFREKELLKQVAVVAEQKIAERQADNAVGDQLYKYQTSAPDLQDRNSVLRMRVDQEFDYILALQGRDARALTSRDRRRFELQAIRAVLGPVEAIRQIARPRPEPTMEIHGATQKPQSKPVNPDQKLLDALTPEQVAHYRKMMNAGQYKGGWKEIVEEIKWVPPVRQ